MKICAASRQPSQSKGGGLRSCHYLCYLLPWQGLDQNVHLSTGHKSDVNMLWQSFPRNGWLTLRRTVPSPGSISMVKGRKHFPKSSALHGNCSMLKYVCTTLSPTTDLAPPREGANDASSSSPSLFPRTIARPDLRNQTGFTVEAAGTQRQLLFWLHSCGWEVKSSVPRFPSSWHSGCQWTLHAWLTTKVSSYGLRNQSPCYCAPSLVQRLTTGCGLRKGGCHSPSTHCRWWWWPWNQQFWRFLLL